jgi:hypothetical protein
MATLDRKWERETFGDEIADLRAQLAAAQRVVEAARPIRKWAEEEMVHVQDAHEYDANLHDFDEALTAYDATVKP